MSGNFKDVRESHRKWEKLGKCQGIVREKTVSENYCCRCLVITLCLEYSVRKFSDSTAARSH